MIYNGLGDRDRALQWLEQAFDERDVRLVFLQVETRWDSLRDSLRFQDLLSRLKL